MLTSTPPATTVKPPHRGTSGDVRSYTTTWQPTGDRAIKLSVMRTGGYYSASVGDVTITRSDGAVVITHQPMTHHRWLIEATARYSAKRLATLNEEATAGLVDRLHEAERSDLLTILEQVDAD